jgi:hypothetical protein
MSNQIFSTLILVARPAAGKSEMIHFLKQTPLAQRQKRFHVGELDELDDFPMLWSWFEEDGLLADMGKPRLYTDAQGNFKWQYPFVVFDNEDDLTTPASEPLGARLEERLHVLWQAYQ